LRILCHCTQFSLYSNSDKVSLTIYYESLCPDSIKFFKDQLSPTYSSLKDHVSLKFIPFGKGTQTITNGTFSFTCHHGETECYGNIVQACAVKIYYGEDVYKIVDCLMTEVDPKTVTNQTYPTVTCLQKLDLQQTKLDECIHGINGLQYLSDMANTTARLNPELKSVPSIAVNMRFDYSESQSAVSDLKNFVCKKLKDSNKKVKECNGSAIVTSSVVLLALSSILSAFISS
ncbi:hypothetical protein L9F63_012957, partial [Diploptera punctata]